MRGELKLPRDIADFMRREGVLSAPSLEAHLLGQVLCELRAIREALEGRPPTGDGEISLESLRAEAARRFGPSPSQPAQQPPPGSAPGTDPEQTT